MPISNPIQLEELKGLPTFSDLTDAQLALVVPLIALREVASGESLIQMGAPAVHVHIVRSGRFGLYVELGGDQERVLLTVARGEVIGWSAFLSQATPQQAAPKHATWRASARALKPSSVFVIDGPGLRGLCESNHELGYLLMRNLFAAVTLRLYDTRVQLLDVYSHA